jgi:chromosome segregation ATPase
MAKAKPKAKGPAKKKESGIRIDRKVRMDHIKALEGIANTLTSDVVKALDIKNEKARLLVDIKQLRSEKAELKSVVANLVRTRDKMNAELKRKISKEQDLRVKIDELKDKNAGLEAEDLTLENKIKHLNQEADVMKKSLEKTNDLLIRLKHEVKQLDSEIKS